MSKIIGIDLGTTNSCISVFEGGELTIIPNTEGNRTTPSIVAITKNGERLVGETAKRQAITNPDRTFASIKRKMGQNFHVDIDGRNYTPQEISAMILGKLKADAESYLGEKVTEAVITVPAYFTDAQRQATKDAGKIAGLDVKRIVNEPTAASLAYGLDKTEEQQKILVFDLGGGTFDVSVLEIGEGVFEVLATNGDNHLGGDDFDKVLMNFIAEKFKSEHGIDLRDDKTSKQRLIEAAEKAKKELSSAQTTNINLPFITASAEGPLHLEMNITRAKFEQLSASLIQKTLEATRTALNDAGINVSELSQIILVGGSTRIPAVQEAIKKITGKDAHKGINPDECVAIGAAIQAGVLSGEVKELLLLDVTPLSLGVETLGGVFTKLIERNTTIPTKKSQIFSTSSDNQTSVPIHILQGERQMAKDNTTLGLFHLDGIKPNKRGLPQIDVTFDIDANGIVHVLAKDLDTGKEQHVTITSSTNLSEEEIQAKIEEAEKFAQEDQRQKQLIEIKNQGESLVYEIERNLNENVSDEDKLSLEPKLLELKEILKTDDIKEIEASMEELTRTFKTVSEKIHQKSHETVESTQGEEIVDADYEVIN